MSGTCMEGVMGLPGWSGEARFLALQLLGQHARRGNLLRDVRGRTDLKQYLTFLKSQDLSEKEADNCIMLCQRWDDFRRAERWNYMRGRPTPTDCTAALVLIDTWERNGRPQ